MKILIAGIVVVVFSSLSAEFVGVKLSEKQGAAPAKVTVCQLKSDPAKYDHKVIEVTGFISHGFENFTIFDPECSSWPSIWLEYGGTTASGTMYCCGVTANRTRPKQLVVEKIPIPLVNDEQFHQFDELIQRRPDSVVRATVLGRFFSGRPVKYPKGTSWGGFGHMGCCSLLAIQQVRTVAQHDRADLDYGASPDQPNISKAGCGYKFLTKIQPVDEIIQLQRKADSGQIDWSFADPKRVASEGLAQLLKVEEASISGLKETRRAPGRFVYEWRAMQHGPTYMVVVSRPYLLSFYAQDPNKVAWVIIAAYESSCGPGNSVRRVN